MPIVRNSFIQISKLPNLKGRISYISSKATQENLYAVYETTDRKFWTELARCNQEEFKKSGTVVGRISLVRLHLGNAKKALISGLAPPPRRWENQVGFLRAFFGKGAITLCLRMTEKIEEYDEMTCES